MNFDRSASIFFSPTGTTKKIVSTISNSLNLKNSKEIDLTINSRPSSIDINSSTIVIIGMPVYRGLLPEDAIERFKKIKGNKTFAIITTVYGNGNCGDALIELKQLATAQGFIPIAEALFIGEHSASTLDFPIGHNRPDVHDLQKAKHFGEIISTKLLSLTKDFTPKVEKQIEIVRQPAIRIPPTTNHHTCTLCKECIDVCPTMAVSLENGKIMHNQDLCITCMACLKTCHTNAIIMKSEKRLNAIKVLYSKTRERKEPAYKVLL